MNWESIQQFFRENPRAWLIGVAAVGVLFVSVWGIWGGFSLQFSNFFAADLNPSASTQSCGSLGGVNVQALDVGSLSVSGYTPVKTAAVADDTFENGWQWYFNVTVPTNETLVKMK
jgi:hypothetical protein